MRGTNSKNMKNGRKKPHFGTIKRRNGSEKLKFPKGLLWSLLCLYTKFQPPTSMCRKDGGGIAFFQGQKWGKSSYLPFLIDLGG